MICFVRYLKFDTIYTMKYDKELNEKITFYIDEEYSRFHAKLIPGVKIRGEKFPICAKLPKIFVNT